MCSVGDDDFENESDKVITKREMILSDKCNKCRTKKACVVLRHKDTYCKNCFLAGVIHKFKALLGKSRLIQPNDKVLVYHKIGHPSTALLHFLRSGLDLNTPKKFRFDIVVLFIEDQYQLALGERQDILKNIMEEVASFGFKLFYVSFIQYLLNPKSIYEIMDCSTLRICEDDKEKLYTILDKKITKTNKNEVTNLLKKQLLIDAAKYLTCKFIFTPEISVDTASQLLSNISLGKGCHVPIDTGFCDNRDEIKILRPLRLFDMKELAFYNKFNNLEPITIRQHEVNYYSSVHDLMKKFVSNLQENYPATITTVIRTGDKLSLDTNGSHKKCKLCKGIMAKRNSELTSEECTKFSHLVSTTIPNDIVCEIDRYQNILDQFEGEEIADDIYCYACSKISPYITLQLNG